MKNEYKPVFRKVKRQVFIFSHKLLLKERKANAEPKWFIGLCVDFDDNHEFDYYVAVSSTNVALHTRFWKEWLPSSGYRRADERIPDVEVYPDVDMPKEDYDYEM